MTVRIVRVTPELNDDYTMALSPAILTPFNADFDGDTLNKFRLMTHELEREHDEHLNPTKNIFVSRNDGLFNNEMNLMKDQIIGLFQFNNI